MAGAHEHTFVNPGGFVHHIGCFNAAPGCIYLGPTETAFSWFPGGPGKLRPARAVVHNWVGFIEMPASSFMASS